MEGIRIGEEAVLKTVGCKSLGGSSPSPSATIKKSGGTLTYVGIERWTILPAGSHRICHGEVWKTQNDL